MPEKTYATEDLLVSSDARKSYIDRTEVLDKVKHLFLIPGLEMTTAAKVAEFYEVPLETVKSVSLRNRGEFESDGLVTRGPTWLKEQLDVYNGDQLRQVHNASPLNIPESNPENTSVGVQIKKKGRNFAVITDDGRVIDINSSLTTYYTKRAVLRMGMLLRDSTVAREVRSQLLNAFEKISAKKAVADIDTETKLMQDAMHAMNGGDMVSAFTAMVKVSEFQQRYKIEAEQLQKENDLLSRRNLTTDKRLLVSRIMRYYAVKALGGKFGWAFSKLYKEMAYNRVLKQRRYVKKNESLLSLLDEDEIDHAITVAASLCKAANLDMADVINTVNAEQYADLIA